MEEMIAAEVLISSSPWPPSSSSCLRSIVAGLLPNDEDMAEVLDVAALLPNASWVLRHRFGHCQRLQVAQRAAAHLTTALLFFVLFFQLVMEDAPGICSSDFTK
jgi:hypothetical protein